MTEPKASRGRSGVRIAQLLLVLSAGGLWAASRMPWLVIRSFDGLGQPREITVSGASWSTGLLPLALLSLAAAVAAMAVRGWRLRVLALLMAAASLAAGYLAVGLWASADWAARGAEIAQIPLISLVGSDRHFGGAVAALTAAVGILAAATLLMRSASAGGDGTGKYVVPAARRAAARADEHRERPELTERMIWDALDDGEDPTEGPTGGPTDGPADTSAEPGAEGR